MYIANEYNILYTYIMLISYQQIYPYTYYIYLFFYYNRTRPYMCVRAQNRDLIIGRKRSETEHYNIYI